jgi:xylulokinase
MAEFTVGIDIGTTSVKALAVDGDGRVLARARVPHRVLVPTPDRMEHEAQRAWRQGPLRALRQVGGAGAKAVNVAAMVPSFAAVDGRGMPKGAGLLYGDERGRVDSPASPGASGEAVAFVRWLAREKPWATGYWPAQAVANHALGGEAVVDTTTAGSLMPLFDGSGWDEKLLAGLGAEPGQFPRVVPWGQAAGRVGGAVLGSGSVDAMGEQLVAGADGERDVLVILGTTLIVWAAVPEWREVPGLWTIPNLATGRIYVGGASNAGGLFLAWATGLLKRAPWGATPHPHGVPIWLPYVRGERTPLHDPYRRASLHGADLTHDAAALRRAAYEAAGFVARRHLEVAGVDPARIVATGGGVQVPEWVQALADCTRLPVDVVEVPEGGALGSAWLARMAAGMEGSMADAARWARVSHTVEPDPFWVEAAAERYEQFVELTESTAPPRGGADAAQRNRRPPRAGRRPAGRP